MKNYEFIPAPTQSLTIAELQPGDTLCTHGDRQLSEKIQHFMMVQGHKWYDVEMWAWFNHMLTIIEPNVVPEGTIIGEAIQSGYNLHPLAKYYDSNAINQMVVVRPKNEFSAIEKQQLIALAEYYDASNIKYEFTNFLWWIPYIYTKGKIDWSPKGSKANDRFFCFEAAMLLWKNTRPGWIDEDASKITTVSLLLKKVIEDVEIYRLTAD